MSGEAKEYIDLWDGDNARMSYRHMPATSLDDLIREEPESIFIHEEKDGFWLSEPGVTGQSQFATLQEAKEAGDKVVEAAEAALPAEMLKDAGLSAEEWKFVEQEPTRFVSLVNEGDEIHIDTGYDVGGLPYTPFAAGSDDDLGRFATPTAAAEAIAAARSPKP